MNSIESNAFLRSGSSSGRILRGSLAGLLAPMRAVLEPAEFGTILSLSPLRFEDVKSIWTSMMPQREAVNLVLGPQPPGAPREALGEGMSLLDDDALMTLTARDFTAESVLVRITGPVESSDGAAIARAIGAGRSPLDAELRAVGVLRFPAQRTLRFESRSDLAGQRMVAEGFRHYIAALRRTPLEAITPPEPWQIQRLMAWSGEISVRPLETEIYSTSIDVGVSTERGGPTRPAAGSIIYDVFSDTWHDEP